MLDSKSCSSTSAHMVILTTVKTVIWIIAVYSPAWWEDFFLTPQLRLSQGSSSGHNLSIAQTKPAQVMFKQVLVADKKIKYTRAHVNLSLR